VPKPRLVKLRPWPLAALITRHLPGVWSIYLSRSPQPRVRRCLHASLDDHHAALSAPLQAVSADECAPWAGIPSSCGLTPVPSQLEFYPILGLYLPHRPSLALTMTSRFFPASRPGISGPREGAGFDITTLSIVHTSGRRH
jgi:hypothetical protein